MTTETLRSPVEGQHAPDGRRLERWHSWVDAIMFVGLLNFFVIIFTLAGGVILGWAPALSAAVGCSRTRVRGDTQQLFSSFARRWRAGWAHANLLAAVPALVLTLLTLNLIAVHGTDRTLLEVGLVVALALCVVHLVLVLAMDAHYDLRRRDCLRLAWAFLVRFPGAPLLLVATTALIGVATALVPGLLPVISIGTWAYLCTALCLSFFAANDRNVPAQDSTDE